MKGKDKKKIKKIKQKQLLKAKSSLPFILRATNWSVFNDIVLIVLETIGIALLVLIWKNVLDLGKIELTYIPIWLVQGDSSLQLETVRMTILLGVIPSLLWLGSFLFAIVSSRYSLLIIRIVFVSVTIVLIFWLVGLLNIKNIAML
ncbi:MAG TPA: hypothetical protein PLL26_04965 [Candidatus Dojkabacteria bacterium]|nr:hypothetical protein [Candidatus Dojkabacteria bacterium]